MGEKVELRVWRGDAGQGQLTDYQVEANEGEVLLDVLHRASAARARWRSTGVRGWPA
jgi:succinate dehydrogenase / fumarate reductase iron-sulfur subunit